MSQRKIVLITGANRGLGEALAAHYLSLDNTVVVSLSRKINTAQEALIGSGRFHFISMDLSRPVDEDRLDLLQELVKSEDKLIYLSNASVISPIAPAGQFRQEEIHAVVSVNAIAPMVLSNYLLKHFPGNHMDLVHISSGAAKRPIGHWSLYCATKALTQQFFDVMEVENAENRVRVFNIDPGVIDTGMQQQLRESDFPGVERFIQLKKEGIVRPPAEVAQNIVDQIS